MKAFFIFFLSLIFLLLRGNDCAHARAQFDREGYAQTFRNQQHDNSSSLIHNLTVSKKNAESEKQESIVSIESENEDEDLTFTRKYVVLAQFFITLSYTTFLLLLGNYLKNELPHCRHLSYTSSNKYILQRVLRI